MIKSFLKDSISYLPAQITPALVGIISIPIITRIFPPHVYGNYILSVATFSVLITIGSWIPVSIIRFFPVYEKKEKIECFFSSVVLLSFISVFSISIIFFILLISIKKLISSDLLFLLLISIGVFICVSFFEVLQYFLRIKRQINLYSGFAVWKSIGALGLGLSLIFFLGFGIESLLLGIIVSILIILPIMWNKVASNISFKIPKLKKSLVNQMLEYSVPLIFGNLAAWILSLSDRYILEWHRGSNEVGIYSASYNISEKSIMLIATLFMLAGGPIAIHIWEKEGEKKSAEFISKVTRFYLLICLPAIIGLIVLSKSIVAVMTGEKYSGGYIIFPFIVTGVLFLGLQQRFQSGFIFYKKTKYITIAIMTSGLLNILLNLILIPKYGYFAAAVTTLVSYIFLLFLMIVLSRRYFIWEFPFKSLVKVIIASGIMGIFVFLLINRLIFSPILNILISVISGLIIYFIILILLNEFTAEEKETVKRWLRNINR